MKDKYETKITSVSGYSGRDYEENLEQFRKDLEQKGGYIDGIVTVRAIVIYRERIESDTNE